MNIPPKILIQIYAQARAEFPNECCGWLTGPRDGDSATAARPAANAYDPTTHPTAPDRTAERAYVIAGADLLELNRGMDDDNPPRVIYHSHPNGRAYFSDTDRRVATDPWGDGPVYPVQQLVIGIDANRVVEARLFDWDEEARGFVEIAKFEGANV